MFNYENYRKQVFITSLLGIHFSSIPFRLFSGQYPYCIKTVTVQENDKQSLSEVFDKYKDAGALVVLRDETGRFKESFYIPPLDIEHLCSVLYPPADLDVRLEKVIGKTPV